MRSDEAVHVVQVSRNANNAGLAGPFCLNSNNSASNDNRNNGAQLAVISSPERKTPCMDAEYVDPIQFGSYGEELGDHQR